MGHELSNLDKAVQLVSATEEYIPQIAKIAYKAFHTVSTRHGFPPDFPNAESAKPVYELLVRRNDYVGLVALLNGKPVGSNFMMKSDTVAAIGPISVDPSVQGKGIGRLMMRAMMYHATLHRFNEVRLLQDSYNVTALSLYASLGFEVRDTIALVHTLPLAEQDHTIRQVSDDDLPTVDRLSRSCCNTSRHNEVIISSQHGFPTFIRERDGKATGYLMPGLAGHGAIETDEDALALLGETARRVNPQFRKFFCPLQHATLFAKGLSAGYRVEKLLTYMTLGPYTRPNGIWIPSAGY